MMMTPTKRLLSCLIAVVVATAASSAALQPAPPRWRRLVFVFAVEVAVVGLALYHSQHH